jgi:hypothetical protein
MLIPNNFHPNTTRNIIIALISHFKDIEVEIIKPETTDVIDTLIVPISFGHMEKYQQSNIRNQQEDKKYYLKYPKMALTWTSITYNGNRERGKGEFETYFSTATELSDATEFVKNINPTPYDLGFELEIRTQSLSQFTQILENILPHFAPNRSLRVKELSFLNVERNLNLINNGISQDFLIEQTEETRRHIRGTISLTVEAFLYKPLSNVSIIKEIRTRYIEGTSADSLSAMSGFNTSGWNSSATFPTSSFDFSGSHAGGVSSTFDFFVSAIDGW